MIFECPTIQSILAKIVATCGPLPEWMIRDGKFSKKLFTRDNVLFHEIEFESGSTYSTPKQMRKTRLELLIPQKIDLFDIESQDPMFLDFVLKLLDVDPTRRLSADEALNHEWLK